MGRFRSYIPQSRAARGLAIVEAMPDSSHPIPKKSGNGGLIVGAALMLLLAAGLVIFKLKSPAKEAEVVEERAAPKNVEPPAPVLDNAPPPPPAEEELAEAPKPEEAKDQKTIKGPAGPPGCAGACAGNAGADLRAALASRAASARSCYNTALRRNATLEGKMTVNVRVSPNGTVCSVGVSNNTLGDAAVASCVSAQFRASKFPAPEGGCVDTAVPLNFTSQK